MRKGIFAQRSCNRSRVCERFANLERTSIERENLPVEILTLIFAKAAELTSDKEYASSGRLIVFRLSILMHQGLKAIGSDEIIELDYPNS